MEMVESDLKMLKKIYLIIALTIIFCNFVFAQTFTYKVQKLHYSDYLSTDTLFVVASFDGSYDLKRWEDILSFAKINGVKFTFFISGVYFLPAQKKDIYVFPPDPHEKGRSIIGFGDSDTDVDKRKEIVLGAIRSGHDIESHLNGHLTVQGGMRKRGEENSSNLIF